MPPSPFAMRRAIQPSWRRSLAHLMGKMWPGWPLSWKGTHVLRISGVNGPSVKSWDRFAVMKARQHQLGRPVADLDLLIAAIAGQCELILATLSVRHFAVINGLPCENGSQ